MRHLRGLPILGLTLSLSLVSIAPAARADGRSDARLHYERGTSLFDLGKYHDAALEYEKAYELKNDPALLFNIGQAYRLANEHNDALTAYRSYLRRSPAAPNRAEVESRIAELQQLVDSEKRAATSPPMGVLKPGQAPEASPPAPSPTEPPPVAVKTPEATAPAPADASLTAAAPSPSPSSDRKPLYKKWWFWTAVGGVVVAGVVVGVAVAATTPHNAASPPGAYTISF